MKKNFLNITCLQATFLLSKKEEGRISLLERLQLRIHLSICAFCKLFAIQTQYIGKHATHSHEHQSVAMSNEVKQNLAKVMQQLQNE